MGGSDWLCLGQYLCLIPSWRGGDEARGQEQEQQPGRMAAQLAQPGARQHRSAISAVPGARLVRERKMSPHQLKQEGSKWWLVEPKRTSCWRHGAGLARSQPHASFSLCSAPRKVAHPSTATCLPKQQCSTVLNYPPNQSKQHLRPHFHVARAPKQWLLGNDCPHRDGRLSWSRACGMATRQRCGESTAPAPQLWHRQPRDGSQITWATGKSSPWLRVGMARASQDAVTRQH